MSHLDSPSLADAQAAAAACGWMIRVDGDGFAVHKMGSLDVQHATNIVDALTIVRKGMAK